MTMTDLEVRVFVGKVPERTKRERSGCGSSVDQREERRMTVVE